ncbi:MAG: ABC transporter substrate-binding protein [Brockia lithotrophica]|nr:ABC transporter substrate-binding protein [Brockia lithotrophica]
MKLARWAFFPLLALALVLGGCGGGEAGKGNEVRIGLNLELSGQTATFGQSAKNGARMAVEKINADGGLLGKKVVLVEGDNKSEKSESSSIALKLIQQDKVDVIVGTTISGTTLAMVNIADENKIPVISPTATNPDVTVDPKTKATRPYVFRACFIDPFQGEVAAKYAIQDLHAKRAAVFTEVSSDYAIGLRDAFKQAFTKLGGEIVAEESYQKNDKDFLSQLTRIRDAKPDVIFLPGYYQEAGIIIKQARSDLGIQVPIIGGDGFDSPKLVEIAGASNMAKVFLTNHYAADDPDPRIQEFVKEYQAKYNAIPDGFAVLGYDAVMLYADAVKRAGSTDPTKVKEALEATKDLPLVSGTITIGPDHNPIKAAVVLEYVDGKQTFRKKVEP